MAYGRRYKKRSMRKRARKGTRKAYRRSKPYQTRFVRMTRWSNKDTTNNVHATLSGNTLGTGYGGSVTFALTDLAGYGEIQALFDNYCIRRVMYRWVLNKDPTSAVSSNGNSIYPRLTWVHDFNDSTVITRAQMQQHPRMREFFFGDSRQHTRWYSLKPSSLTLLYEAVGTTAYKPSWGSFVDTSDVSMAHYGIKYSVSNLFSDNFIYLEAKVVVDAKGIS